MTEWTFDAETPCTNTGLMLNEDKLSRKRWAVLSYYQGSHQAENKINIVFNPS